MGGGGEEQFRDVVLRYYSNSTFLSNVSVKLLLLSMAKPCITLSQAVVRAGKSSGDCLLMRKKSGNLDFHVYPTSVYVKN